MASLALVFVLSAAGLAQPQRGDGDRDRDNNNNGNVRNPDDVGDVDYDDVPVVCREVCNPVVMLTQNCDSSTRDDDAAELRCICTATNASTDIPACAACVNQSGGWGGRNDDVNDLVRACAFPPPTNAPSAGPAPTEPTPTEPTPTGPRGNNGQGGAVAPAPTGCPDRRCQGQGQGGQGQGGQNGQGVNGQGQNGQGGQTGNGQTFGAGAVQGTGRPNAAPGNKLGASALIGILGIAGLAFFL
ncbi:gpi anchored [Pyrenophora seminiperda CCB06]|uniref:Gpi anchored n=1 Tax=Pyrenophora seminiperda CCB06 TaxID=1302712 RepID=A0A3M7LVX1_9PLEO|nr:gpi anchored [Pyrenophora seminiperda CCB06]